MTETCVQYERPKTVIIIAQSVRQAEHVARERREEFSAAGERVKVMSYDLAGRHGLEGIRPDYWRLIVLPPIGRGVIPLPLLEQIERIRVLSSDTFEVEWL